MKSTLLLVADTAYARIFNVESPSFTLLEIEAFTHAER